MSLGGPVPVVFFAERNQVIAYSPALDLSTCASSKKGALKMFTKACRLFFEDLEQAGTTADVLKSLGWYRKNESWSPPKIIGVDEVQI